MLSTADAFPAEARRIVNAANIAMPVPADIVCLHTFVEDYCGVRAVRLPRFRCSWPSGLVEVRTFLWGWLLSGKISEEADV